MNDTSKVLASKLISQLAEELGISKAEGAAPIAIMTDGTPEGTMVLVNGQPIAFEGVNLYCCTTGEYPCCDVSVTIGEDAGNGLTVRKTMQLRKDTYDKE